jgi:hypothetical protein
MADTTVVIRRQVLEVDLRGTEAEGQALQQRLPRVCADVLSPAIESALAALGTDGSPVHLDRLELDLTLTSLEGFETELADAVRRGIAGQLHRRTPSAAVGLAAARAGPGEQPPQAATPSVDEALVSFLRTGRLPWWFSLSAGQTLEAVVLAAWQQAGRTRAGPPTDGPLRAVLAAAGARERLVAQFTPDVALTVLRALSPELALAVEQIEASLGGSGETSAGRVFGRRVWQAALEAVVTGREPEAAALVARAWTTTDAAERADPGLAAAVARIWPGGPATTTVAEKAPGPDTTAPAAETGSGPAAAASAALAYGWLRGQGGDTEADGLLVDNAGLVLLHPFLTTLFTGLGVAVGDELVAPCRALALVHHLATGELVAPEHRLTLAKALCGVPLDAPCDTNVGLTNSETAEATALLEAAIGHWAALRNTSPAGLQAEFLQRPGLLSTTAYGDWLLRVEGRTVDILLDQLPWGFSSFRLPWMSRLMMVEWR